MRRLAFPAVALVVVALAIAIKLALPRPAHAVQVSCDRRDGCAVFIEHRGAGISARATADALRVRGDR